MANFSAVSQVASVFVIIVSLYVRLPMLAESYVVRKGITYPQCDGNESCLYIAMGHRFEFCSCSSEQNVCGKSNAVINQDVEYYFCSERFLRTCNIGDVSTIVYGLKTYVECVCPDRFELIARSTPDKAFVEYICDLGITCSPGQACARQTKLALLKKCSCAEGLYCAMPNLDHGMFDGYCEAEE